MRRPKVSKKLDEFAAIAKRFQKYTPAREVLTLVTSVPTCFVQFDHGVGVGGMPLRRCILVHGPSNEGKAFALDTPVLTPNGWVEIGSLKVGDIVSGANGQSCRVKGVFPQGEKDLFTVRFSDGTSVECCEEHLWATRTGKEKNKCIYSRGPRPTRVRIPTGEVAPFIVRTLAEIARTVGALHEIPLVAPVHYSRNESLLIDPYALGLLLGDGNVVQMVRFCKPEDDLHEKLEQSLLPGDRMTRDDEMTSRIVGGATRSALERLGIFGCRSWEKFIPDCYKYADTKSRLELLRGLVDTDGAVTKDGVMVEFASSSPRLFADVVELARGLGAYVSTTSNPAPQYSHNGIAKTGRPAWRARIAFNDGTIPVASKKNLAKWKGRNSNRLKRIVSVIPSRRALAVCIAVDSSDHLYVVKDFIVTHNSEFVLGLIASYVSRGHLAMFIDAERTTPIDWAEKLMGKEIASSDLFKANKPDSYEGTIALVRNFLNDVKDARACGEVPPDMGAIVVVDSLRKLVPADLLKEILEAEKDAKASDIKSGRDRRAQLQAKMNTAWMDELIMLTDKANATFVAIAREMDDPDADIWDKRRGEDYKVGGGVGIYYDASLAMRIERESWVTHGEGKEQKVYGERRKVTIRKTKVSGKDAKVVRVHFHSSNGVLIPPGFDRARDVLELGEEFKIVTRSGGWYSFNGKRLGNGHAAVKSLTEDKLLLASIEKEVRTKFESHEPIRLED